MWKQDLHGVHRRECKVIKAQHPPLNTVSTLWMFNLHAVLWGVLTPQKCKPFYNFFIFGSKISKFLDIVSETV